jgi:hypothetical protein
VHAGAAASGSGFRRRNGRMRRAEEGRTTRDEPYGDRVFECIDPFGYLWEISTDVRCADQ